LECGGEEESEEESNTEDSLGISVGKERNPPVKGVWGEARWGIWDGDCGGCLLGARSSDFFYGWGGGSGMNKNIG
jgi:hypothetical protein